MIYRRSVIPSVVVVLLLVLTSNALGSVPTALPHLARGAPSPSAALDPGVSELVSARESLAAGLGPAHGATGPCRSGTVDQQACSPPTSSPAAGGAYGWTAYPDLPTGRTGSLMAYDPVDGYVVLFGGFECTPVVDCGGWLNDTWAFSHGVWTNLTPTASVAPAFHPGSEMVWDGADGYVLLETTANTTWSFVGGVWSQIVTTNGPGARLLPGLAYDAADGYVVLFGGAGLNSPTGQTWTYRGSVWTQLNTTTSPWNRNDVAFDYDATDGYAVLFGGAGIVSGSQVRFNDTWTFLAGNWTLLPNANGPGPRFASFDAYGYDPLLASIVGVIDPTYSSSNYLWEFAGGAWSQVNGTNQSAMPLLSGGTYDASDAEFLFVAGGSWFYYGMPYWIASFSLTNFTWAQIGTAPQVPTNLGSYTRLATDPADGGLLLTDGQTTLLFANDSWDRGVTQSTTQGCTPEGLAYDAADGYVLMYCGETWKFEGGNWTRLPQYAADTWPSISGVMSYDTADRCVVLYGGGPRNETWTWSAGNWTNVTNPSAPGPTARYGAAFADDPVDGYVVLFGGYLGVSYSGVLNDTWTFQGGTWSRVVTSVAPSARGGAAMAFDDAARYDLLFGGDALSYNGPMDHDTWSFSAGTWTDLSRVLGAAPQPPGRTNGVLGYDPTSGRMLLLGGYSNGPLSLSEWFWGTGGPGAPPVISSFVSEPAVTDVNVSVTLRTSVVGGAAPLTFAYTGLPAGCWAGSSPTVTCRPSAPGAFTIVVVVTDATGNSTWDSLFLLVHPPPSVVLFTIFPAAIQLGQKVGMLGTFTGGTAPYSIAFTGLPAGCTPPPTTSLSCTPSEEGNFSISLTERDSVGLVAVGRGNLSVVGPPGPGSLQISGFSVAPADVTLGGTVVVSTVTLGGIPPLSFNYSGLPGGCAAPDAAAFFCTPTEAGEFAIHVEVSDQTPVHLLATALLLVESTVGSGPPPVPRIESFKVSPATVDLGGSVTFQVNATGGTPPYEFAYSGVPAGCAAADAPSFSCVPSLAAQWAVGVTVTDAKGYFAQAVAALTVTALSSAPGTNAPGSAAGVPLMESVLLVAVGALAGILAAIMAVVVLRRRSR